MLARIAGISGNTILDPGEGFLDNDNSGKFDAGDTDMGFFNSFVTDARVGINTTQTAKRSCAIVFIATNTNAVQGLYSTRLNFFGDGTAPFNALMPAGFTVTSASLVAEVGSTLPKRR